MNKTLLVLAISLNVSNLAVADDFGLASQQLLKAHASKYFGINRPS